MFHFNESDLKQTVFYQQVFGEGKDEGREEGRVEGEAAVVRRLLERRFGPLPESARNRLAAADADTLLVWADRLLDAATLEDVFGH